MDRQRKGKMERPNFLFIYIDDMGWKDLTCTGSTFYETPNIDRLCREGMSFGNAYASCPVCSPSRASFLTGKYPARLGLTDWIDMNGNCHPRKGRLIDAPYIHHLPDGEYTIANALKDNGYAAWHVGKWHQGGRKYYPKRVGFDVNIGGCGWGAPYGGYFAPYGIETLKEGPEGEYLIDRLTEEAISLIKEHCRTGDSRPFFLNLWHYAVHTPIQAKQEDVVRFEEKAKRLGLNREKVMKEEGFHHTKDRKGEKVLHRILQSDPAYAAMIWNLDWNIGRLLDTLKECGQEENTVVIFTSDNGGYANNEGAPTCNLPAAEGKGWLYEGGLRVPLLVRYPRLIRAGGYCNTPVITPDFYPTLLELAGIEKKPGMAPDGRSMVPLLKGESIPERPLFWHYPHYGDQGGQPCAAVLLGKYKYLFFYDEEREELYDLQTDLAESRNLAQRLPETAEKMRFLLWGWQQEIEARFPEVNPD